MAQPEKRGYGPEDNELREATRRRHELNTYLLVSIGMQTQFSPTTTRGVLEPLPGPDKETPQTVELHETIRELILVTPGMRPEGIR